MALSVSDIDGHLSIRLEVELRYAPQTRRERLNELRRFILDGLRITPNTTLAKRMDMGSVSVEINFFGPNALKAPLLIKM